MKFKKFVKKYWWVSLLLLLLLLIGLFIYGGYNGWYSSGSNTYNTYTTTTTTNNPANPNNDIVVNNVPTAEDNESGLLANLFNFFVPVDNVVDPIVIPKVYSCTDVDNQGATNQYFIGGNTLDQDGTGSLDLCNGNVLTEQVCIGASPSSTTVDCADYGRICSTSNGKGYCKIPVTCSDSDLSDNEFVQGTCVDESGSHLDSCGRGNTLTEYYCRNNMCASKTFDCGLCSMGSCGLLV